MIYATRRKEEGNDLVKRGFWKEANEFYETGLSFVHYLEGKNADEKARQKEITLSILLNRSLCYLKLAKWKELALVCNEAISIDPQNVKALFRRGAGYKQQGRTDLAMRDLKKAHELAPVCCVFLACLLIFVFLKK
ncbi:hypothetical protein FACS189472_14710 [Alphaproteobacteria bacterium]|nr:hypothetical protein FACS189472_14710 [Alphaproteobacteria bacterium]